MFLFKAHPAAAAAKKSLQSCPTLCDPIDSSPPGFPVPGILQARTLEWVAISFANAWKWKNKVKLLSCVLLLATPWTAAHQAPLSMGFSRQEYWSGVPLPSPLYILSWAKNTHICRIHTALGILCFVCVCVIAVMSALLLIFCLKFCFYIFFNQSPTWIVGEIYSTSIFLFCKKSIVFLNEVLTWKNEIFFYC